MALCIDILCIGSKGNRQGAWRPPPASGKCGVRIFAWDRSGPSVGSVANTARWPRVHTHWLFYFPVADLEGSLELVRTNGGRTLAPFVLPNGHRLVPCDDPQGAAFGLFSAVR